MNKARKVEGKREEYRRKKTAIKLNSSKILVRVLQDLFGLGFGGEVKVAVVLWQYTDGRATEMTFSKIIIFGSFFGADV